MSDIGEWLRKPACANGSCGGIEVCVCAGFEDAADEINRLKGIIEKDRAALISIAHTFTEDSHGNMKYMPASYYQNIARVRLAEKENENG